MNITINSQYLENVYGVYFIDLSANTVDFAHANEQGTYNFSGTAIMNNRFVVVAKEGYDFDPNLTYTINTQEGQDGYKTTGKRAKLSDYTYDTLLKNYSALPVTWDANIIQFDKGEDIKYYRNYIFGQAVFPINAISSAPPVTYDITFKTNRFSFNNCSCNTQDGQKVNPNDKIIVTADNGYEFPTDFDYYLTTGTTTTCDGVLSNANTVVTYTVPDDPNIKELGLDHSITADPVTPPTPTGKDVTIHYNGKTFTNCTVNVSDGGIIKEGNTLLVTANTGYRFNNSVSLGNDATGTQSVKMTNNINTLSLRIASTTFDNLYFLSDVVAEQETVVTQDGFCHVYNPTSQELADLSNIIFITFNNEQISFTEYITRLYNLPFVIDNSMIKDTSYIILGDVQQAQVKAKKLNVWKYTVDVGSITIPDKYNNVYSYKNFYIRIYVPFFGFYDLDNTVVGKTINISFIIDLYNGESTLTIKRDNVKILTDTRNIGNDIPFFHKEYATLTNNDVGQLEDTYTAFVEVSRNTPHTTTGFLGKTERYYVTMNELSGYVEISDISFNGNIPYEYQTEIINLLRQGVIL